MKAILTGAGGQLGQQWLEWAKGQSGVKLFPFTRDELDITNAAEFDKKLGTLKADLWINCAGYTQVDRAEDEPVQAFRINAEAVAGIASWCHENQIKLIHYSTDYVFSGSDEDRIRYPEGYPEYAETAPIGTYGMSKAEGEKQIQKRLENALILRVSWLCGAFGHNFVKTMLRLSAERSEIRVVADQVGAPAFCEDIVVQSMDLVRLDARGIFHLGSRGLCSWFEFAKEILNTWERSCTIIPIPSSEFPTKALRPTFSKLDIRAYESLTGKSCPQWKNSLANLKPKL